MFQFLTISACPLGNPSCGRTFPPLLLFRITTPVCVLSLAVFAQLFVPVPLSAESTDRPNIILMMADDMGFSDLGCYGGEIETPNLDQLAQGGIRFTQFYNTARCCPTRAALLTGLHQHQAGIGHMVGDYGIPSYQGYLNDQCVTIAEALRGAGYTTLMSGKWHVGSRPEHWPTKRGFDRYWGTPSGGGVYFKDTLQIRNTVFFVNNEEKIELPDDFYITDDLTDRAIKFIDEAVNETKKPFFLYLAHIAPHWPLQAKPEDIARYDGKYNQGWDAVREARFERQASMKFFPSGTQLSSRDKSAKAWNRLPPSAQEDLAHRMEIYAAQISCIDDNVGTLITKLKELGQYENTLFIFLSDNGCSAEGGPGGFSRGKKDAPIGTGLSYASVGLEWANANDTPFRKFKMDTREGGISSPLIIHWPQGVKSNGRLVDASSHVIDVMPTLLEVARATYPDKRNGKATIPLEGQSFANQFSSTKTVPDRDLFWEHEGNQAIRRGDWKALRINNGPWSLYNLKDDRTETTNLSKTHPEITKELATAWEAWAQRCGVWDWNKLQEHRRKK
ncbi:arylsulfatase [Bremerella alba]|uniref:Arylsulfatase n=1 Tax=Bremerella alba TaxID=980252 RepID=A0A7V8V107_9BACT|nr:arylsulfatase [Bremerella alba]MBA2112962.1 Arylsulfatase [Bremerella alba]